MKILRISDELHKQLKREAKADGRTLQWYVENRLSGGVIPMYSPPIEGMRIPPMEPVYTKTPSLANVQTLEIKNTSEAAPDISMFESPCCLSQCKHWTYDGVSGMYKNSISGRLREPEYS